MNQLLEEKLVVGAKVKLGKNYCEHAGCIKDEGVVIELIEGHFEYDNGLYTEDQVAPAIYNETSKDFDSIFHLFGNDFEYFLDCEILS
jgi:hypothetical protein